MPENNLNEPFSSHVYMTACGLRVQWYTSIYSVMRIITRHCRCVQSDNYKTYAMKRKSYLLVNTNTSQTARNEVVITGGGWLELGRGHVIHASPYLSPSVVGCRHGHSMWCCGHDCISAGIGGEG